MPDEAMIEIGGSPVRWEEDGGVGATQAGQTGQLFGMSDGQIMAMDSNGGSPRFGHGDAGEGDGRDDGSPIPAPKGPPPESLGTMIGQWKSQVARRV